MGNIDTWHGTPDGRVRGEVNLLLGDDDEEDTQEDDNSSDSNDSDASTSTDGKPLQ